MAPVTAQIRTTIKSGPLYRSAALVREDVNEDNRTVSLSFSSEEPYERWFGVEILDHGKKSVRLDRLKKGGPLLVGHDPRDHVGKVEDVSIGTDRKGRAVVRFGKSARADEIFRDVVDGIRSTVSVGYRVHRMVMEEENDDTSIYRVTDWEPMEVSLVSVPADITVGVGRSTDEQFEIEVLTLKKEAVKMPDEPKKKEDVTPSIDLDAERDKMRKAEQKRTADIMTIGESAGLRDLAVKYVQEGKSVEAFKDAVIEHRNTPLTPLTPATADIGLSEKEVQQFSFIRAILAQVPNSGVKADFERECSDAAAKKMGVTPKGILVPNDVLRRNMKVPEKRDLTVSGTSGYTVATDLMSGNFIEILRNRMSLGLLGSTYLTGLTGDIAIPKQTGAATAYWVTEGNAPTESTQTLGQVTGTPKTCGAFTDISRKLLKQSSIDAEMFVRNDLASVLGIAIDAAGFNGSGASGQPTGIVNNGSCNNPSIASAGTPTYAEIVAFIENIKTDNADLGELMWALTAEVWAKLATTLVTPTYGDRMILDVNSDRLLGRSYVTTENLPANSLFLGDWRQLIIAMWGTTDILVDPYTASTTGTVRVVALQDVDVLIRYPVAFAYNTAVTA